MGFSMRAEVDARDVARVMRVLRKVDKSLADELKSSIGSGIQPIADLIGNRVSANSAPMSGMTRRGVNRPNRYEFAKGKMKVRVTPGFSFRSPNLVTLEYLLPKNRVGVAIADMAGRKTQGNSPQGQAFIRQIMTVVPGWGDGGRYVFRAFLPYRSHVYRLGENILARWVAKTNQELESR